jgi:3-deoxy-D-manno-octulosonate 8-phosphate phosphatase (KDO 8-P phosphatase)
LASFHETVEIAKRLKMFLCDVDGVLTDGGIILDGIDVQDGLGIAMIRQAGLIAGIITGRKSGVVKRRAEELKFDEICQGFFWKEEALEQLLDKHQLRESQIAYIGDDLLDIPVLRRVGLPIAVQNARPEVKASSLYTSSASGGHGAVREIVEWILQLRNQKQEILDHFTKSRE